MMPFLGLLLFALSPLTLAATPLNDEQARNLGISTAAPIADDTAMASSFLGQVQIAPQAKRLIARPYQLQILSWQVSLGDRVNPGQPLLSAYSPALQALEHKFHNAHYQAQLAGQKLERERKLISEGIISRKQFEVTQAEYRQAQENHDGLLSELSRMGLSEQEMTTLKNNQHLDGHITLTAPSAGRVASLNVSQGQSVAENTTLLTLLASDELTIDIPMPPAQAATLKTGDQLYLSDQTPIRIEAFRAQVSDAQKTLVIGSTRHPDLKPGQWIRVNLPKQTNNIHWRVPRSALIHLNNQPHLILRTTQGLEAIEVILVRASRDGWVISSPHIHSDSRILVSGTAAAKGMMEAETP